MILKPNRLVSSLDKDKDLSLVWFMDIYHIELTVQLYIIDEATGHAKIKYNMTAILQGLQNMITLTFFFLK